MKKFILYLFFSVSFCVYSAEKATFGDVVFNEIMAAPATGQPEFIELFNRSGKTLQLEGWKYYYANKPYTLPDVTMNPSDYLVLCKPSEVQSFPSDIKVVGVTSFPVLANTGKLLFLEDKESTLISWFEYSDKLYGSTEKKAGGWSLECIDPSNLSNSATNWIASVAQEGHTAGKRNSVDASNPDSDRPFVQSFEVIEDNNTVILTFSKPMDKSSLTAEDGYIIEDPDYRIMDLQINYPQGDQVTILLNRLPPKNSMITIRLDGDVIRDISGFSLQNGNDIVIGSGEEALPLEVVINEIMFNAPATSEEYVELYNRSDKTIDLRYLTLVTRKTDGELNKIYPLTTAPVMLYAGEYIAVSKSITAVCAYFNCTAPSALMESSVVPVLNNTSGDLVLLNNVNNEIIDELVYNEKMHSEAIKDKKGVALERISPDSETNNPENWQSAASLSGFGTPGYANSQTVQNNNPLSVKDEITIAYPDFFIGNDAYRICYRFTTSGNRCRIFLFDTMGRMLQIIVNNELLGTEGEITWFGANDSGQKWQSGLYIIYAEVITSTGNIRKFKLPVVIK